MLEWLTLSSGLIALTGSVVGCIMQCAYAKRLKSKTMVDLKGDVAESIPGFNTSTEAQKKAIFHLAVDATADRRKSIN
jgi:hypothetical protein